MYKINKTEIAKYWIPTEDEWYKAAFYDPTLNDGSGGYWSYATKSNSVPTPITADSIGNGSAGPNGNFANFNRTSDWNNDDGNVTTVGTNGGPSYYGTFDQSGNAYEWNDAVVDSTQRGLRGGYWLNLLNNDEFRLSTTGRNSQAPTLTNSSSSMRIASINNILELSNFVDVSNANNSNDSTGYGSVSYDYKIGKYEVTNSEYAEFLNAVASVDTYGLYESDMNSTRAGITRSGTSGNYIYTVNTNWHNKPIVFISWFRAARYCNWLHNNKPTGFQTSSTTEDGAYTLNGANSGIIYKNQNFRINFNNTNYRIRKENN